jgi:hypothetical protein
MITYAEVIIISMLLSMFFLGILAFREYKRDRQYDELLKRLEDVEKANKVHMPYPQLVNIENAIGAGGGLTTLAIGLRENAAAMLAQADQLENRVETQLNILRTVRGSNGFHPSTNK